MSVFSAGEKSPYHSLARNRRKALPCLICPFPYTLLFQNASVPTLLANILSICMIASAIVRMRLTGHCTVVIGYQGSDRYSLRKIDLTT
jgi:hypothetical protein